MTSPKLRSLQDMRERLTAGSYSELERKELHVADTDGTMVRMGDDNALAVIDRRIAAQQEVDAAEAEQGGLSP